MSRQKQILAAFGERLKAERKKQGLTQQGLAEKAQSTQDYIAQIERGVRNPSLITLINLLVALDVSADYLVLGVDDKKMSEMENILAKFHDFIIRRNLKDALAYYDIINSLSKHIDSDYSHDNSRTPPN